MKLRAAPRYKRRVPVRFWEPESGNAHQAFTIDISLSGLFIATRTPLPLGARFRLETLEPEHNYVFQGEVVRSAKVAPELQKISPTGMGVRLLEVRELVEELIPRAAGRPHAATRPAAPSPGARPGAPPSKLPPATNVPGRYAVTPPSAARPVAPDEDEVSVPVYLLRFATPEVFLQIFLDHREEGGFFVPTRKPAPVGNPIRVTLELMRTGVEPLELDGRVESHLHDEERPDDPPTGMRVSFVDSDAAMEQLRAIIRRLREGG